MKILSWRWVESILNPSIRQALISDTEVKVEENEVLFEFRLDRVMYARLENQGTPDEHPLHHKWRTIN
jgi:hypothetical protein